MAALCKITKDLKISTSISRETKINPPLINGSIVERLRYVKLQVSHWLPNPAFI